MPNIHQVNLKKIKRGLTAQRKELDIAYFFSALQERHKNIRLSTGAQRQLMLSEIPEL